MRCLLLALLFVLGMPRMLVALDIGTKAPPLKVAKWLSGEKKTPDLADGKHVYIVEMWATWCPACKMSIPMLNGILRQFKDQGVVVLGITAEEEPLVADFLKKTRVEYGMGLDDGTATIDAYEAKATGIPMAYIVDKTGKIVWKGNPLDGLDRTIRKVLAGTWDPKVLEKKEQLETRLKAAVELSDVASVLATIDALITAEPDNPKYYRVKLGILSEIGVASSKQLQDIFRQWAKGCADYAPGLMRMAMAMREQPYELRDPELMLSAAQKAVTLTKGRDAEILSGLASICAELSRLDDAQKHVRAALKVAPNDETRNALQAQLDYFTKVKRLKTN